MIPKNKRPGFPGRWGPRCYRGGCSRKELTRISPKSSFFLEKSKKSSGMMERVITYIDGFNLYFGIKALGGKSLLWLDLQLLSESLLQPNQTLAGVKYFTSHVAASPDNPDKKNRQSAYLDALATRPQVTNYYGQFKLKKVECRECRHSYKSYVEKKTDVNLSVEMMADAHEDAFDVALVISGDSDLVPPIERIKKTYGHKKKVVAVFPPNRVSKDLRSAANTHLTLWPKVLKDSQLPDTVEMPNGFVIYKPSRW